MPPIYSANQGIDIRYKEEVLSADVNKKLKDAFGGNAKLSGLTLSHVSGLNCKINAGRMVIQGASIEEAADIQIQIPSNAGGPQKTHYLYAYYTHGENEVCAYTLLESETVAPNHLLIGSVLMPANSTVVTPGNVESTPVNKGILALEIALTALGNIVDTLGNTVSTMGTTVSGHTTSISGLSTNVSTLLSQMGTANGDIDDLEADVVALFSQMGTANSNIGSHTLSISGLNTQMSAANSAISTLNTSVSTLSTQMQTANNNISTLQSSNENKIAWANKTTRTTEQINSLNLGGAIMAINGATPTGTSNVTFNAILTVTKSFNAAFNDYAEWFERFEETEPGDVIAVTRKTKEERYGKADKYFSTGVVGVHSDEFAMCIGADGASTDIEKYIPVGMLGRVHVKVIGIVQKDDYIALSDIPGVGVSVGKDRTRDFIFAKAVAEDLDNSGIKKVRCLLLPN